MPESSSQEYDEDEEPESEDEASGDVTSNSEDEEDEEELCSLVGSPFPSQNAQHVNPGFQNMSDLAGSSLRNRITNKSSVQPTENFLSGSMKMPPRPMMEQLAGSNIWYQAYILRESKNEVKVRFPPFDSEDEERIEWVRKCSSRIWRGSYRNSQWKHLGRGAWAPKAHPKRIKRRSISSKGQRRKQCQLSVSDTSGDEDTGMTGTYTDDADVHGSEDRHDAPHSFRNDDERLSVLRQTLRQQQFTAQLSRGLTQAMSSGPAKHMVVDPVAEEHSERGHCQRGSNRSHSDGLIVSNKENCDRNSAKSNPSGFKGIFSCSEPEDQGAEGGVDQAEYDPLTKWFEVHFQQLHAHGKVPRDFPFGTPESGVLPSGFSWHSSGVVFSQPHESSLMRTEAKLQQDEMVLCAPSSSTQVKAEPTSELQPVGGIEGSFERACKLRKLKDNTCFESVSGNAADMSCPPGGSDTLVKHPAQLPASFDSQLHCVAPAALSPGMSPISSGADAVMTTVDGGTLLLHHDISVHPALACHACSPGECKTSSTDGPQGGSSQSESDVLLIKEQFKLTNPPAKFKGSQDHFQSMKRDVVKLQKSSTTDGKRKLPQTASASTKVKRKRAVIVSDDDDDEVAHISAIASQHQCAAAHHNSETSLVKMGQCAVSSPLPARVASVRNFSCSSAQACGNGQKMLSVAKAIESNDTDDTSAAHKVSSSNCLVASKIVARKPPVSLSSGRGGPAVAAVDLQKQSAFLSNAQLPSPVPKPAWAPYSRVSGVCGYDSGRSKLGADNNATKKHMLTSSQRMLPHKKALLAAKLQYDAR